MCTKRHEILCDRVERALSESKGKNMVDFNQIENLTNNDGTTQAVTLKPMKESKSHKLS